MYIDNDDFSVWMQKLYAKLEELCKDVRVLRNADKVLPEDDNLLDNRKHSKKYPLPRLGFDCSFALTITITP